MTSKTVALTGDDTVVFDGRIFNDLADGDAISFTFPVDIATVKVGKNGTSIYAFNETGSSTECIIRLVLGSSDDKYMNSRFQEMQGNRAGFNLFSSSFTKRVGDGEGNISSVVYKNDGGIFKKSVEVKSSAEGDTEQSIAIYTITFANSSRSIQ